LNEEFSMKEFIKNRTHPLTRDSPQEDNGDLWGVLLSDGAIRMPKRAGSRRKQLQMLGALRRPGCGKMRLKVEK
jgi:hypothetical protein